MNLKLYYNLIEECSEVQKASTKILRFGTDGKYPNGINNVDHLKFEIGNLLAVLSELHGYWFVFGKNNPNEAEGFNKKISQMKLYGEI